MIICQKFNVLGESISLVHFLLYANQHVDIIKTESIYTVQGTPGCRAGQNEQVQVPVFQPVRLAASHTAHC